MLRRPVFDTVEVLGRLGHEGRGLVDAEDGRVLDAGVGARAPLVLAHADPRPERDRVDQVRVAGAHSLDDLASHEGAVELPSLEDLLGGSGQTKLVRQHLRQRARGERARRSRGNLVVPARGFEFFLGHCGGEDAVRGVGTGQRVAGERRVKKDGRSPRRLEGASPARA
ncbi:hypothetical protein CBD41_09140 [bacterium TMED181]|nr:MAG: hypothetical protein CBD41_09140 [bacterium TMED181]